MLRIPVAGDAIPPLVGKKSEKISPVSLPESFQRAKDAKAREGLEPGDTTGDKGGNQGEWKRRKRTAEMDPDDELGWEKEQQRRIRVSKKKSKTLLWVAGSLVLLVILAGVAVLLRPKPLTVVVVDRPPASAVPVDVVPGPEAEPIALPMEMEKNESELLSELEPLAKSFLEATTVEELLPLVRNPSDVERKMRGFYPDGKVEAPGMGAFNTLGAVAYRGKLASIGVRTGDFEAKQIAFLRTSDGMKIDWESYVGWSEMNWEELVAKRPAEPVLFRVAVRPVEYYNFSFSDDLEWRSYQLTSADGNHVVYGYVKRGSEADKALHPVEKGKVSLHTVKLKFPESEEARNQVLVDSVVADGWVVDSGE